MTIDLVRLRTKDDGECLLEEEGINVVQEDLHEKEREERTTDVDRPRFRKKREVRGAAGAGSGYKLRQGEEYRVRNVRPIISASRRGTDDAKSTNHDSPGDMAERITSDIKEEVGKNRVREKKRKERKKKSRREA